MAKTIALINTAADTFQDWVNKTNELCNVVIQEVFTANTNANGATTTGNSFLVGIFGANTITVTTLRGGNVQSSANLTISSNVTHTGDFLIIDTDKELSCINVQTSGTSAQLLDSFSITTWHGGEYLLTVKDNAANAHQISRFSVLQDGDVYYNEYGLIYSNTLLNSYAANANSTHVRVYVTPTVANSQIKATRTLVKV